MITLIDINHVLVNESMSRGGFDNDISQEMTNKE